MENWACAYAAMGGHLECLRYAHESGCPFAAFTCLLALQLTLDARDCDRHLLQRLVVQALASGEV